MSLLNTNIGPERVQVFPESIGVVLIPGAATDIAGFLISTNLSGAPVNSAVQITSLTDFTNSFGDSDNACQGYYAVEYFYQQCGTGNTAWVVNVGDGVEQTSQVTAVADVSGSLNNTYFLLSNANNATNYYVWYNINGAGTNPAIADKTGVEVSAATDATADTIATDTAAAINAITASFTASAVSAVVTITNVATGPSTDVQDGSSATDFTFSTPTSGRLVDATDYIGGTSPTPYGIRVLDNIDSLGLVMAPGLSLPLAYLVQPAIIDYALTVRTEFGATISTTFSLTAIPQEITTSQTDVEVTSGTVSSISGNQVVLSGATLTNVTPGMVLDYNGTFVSTITAVNTNTSTITLVSNPTGVISPTETVVIATPCAITYKENVINIPSRTNGWYYNWLVVNDESSMATPGELLNIDPSGAVAGIMARIDSNTSIGGVSHAPAGIQFAGITGIQGLQLIISERIDAGPLRLNFINRITSFPGSGNVVFGAYTSDSGETPQFTAQDELIQVIRSVQFIKSSLEAGLLSFIWENYSPDTQLAVANAISSFLRRNNYLFPAGLPEAQQFQVVSITPTQDDIDQGLLIVTVLIRPNTAVRFIEVDLEYPIPAQQ